MQTILCIYCKKPFEISQAIADQMSEEEKIHREEAIAAARLEEKTKLEKKLKEELSLKEKDFQNQIKEDSERIGRLMQDILKANEEMRTLKKRDEEREIENQRKMQTLEVKLKEEAIKQVDEEKKYEILQMKKQLEDTQKALEEARRKSEQVSQQLQGEVLELELESILRTTFPHDDIEPIGKGITGADIRHVIKSPLGNTCGVILWESKRTKNWDDKWIIKLKDDLRAGNAHFAIIVSSVLPKDIPHGVGFKDGVYVCSDKFVLFLAGMLRKNLYDVTRQKTAQVNSTEKAQLVISYLTGHEFQQQVESIVE